MACGIVCAIEDVVEDAVAASGEEEYNGMFCPLGLLEVFCVFGKYM